MFAEKYYLFMKRAMKNSKSGGRIAVGRRREVRNNALETIKSVMDNERYAVKFFFGEMYPKMKSLSDSYNHQYGLELTPEDVAGMAFLSCWENNWAKLRTFKGDTTAHAWVGLLASQSAYRQLVEEKYIDISAGGSKTGDFRLTIRSIEDQWIRQSIVDMVDIPDQHKALEIYYVRKDDADVLAREFGDDDKAREILKSAEQTLIKRLLSTENPYAEIALSTRSAGSPETQFQVWHDRVDEADVSENHRALRETLSNLYGCEDWDSNVVRFINGVVDNMGWSEVQKAVWRERFFNETPSKELAKRFKVRNTWIDNTYSRLNKQFRKEVRRWWTLHDCG